MLAPPTSAASGSVRSSSGSTARLSGMVSDRPAHRLSHEASRPGRAGLVALDRGVGPAVQAERGVRGRVQHGRQRVGDRRAEDRRRVRHDQPWPEVVLEFGTELLELRLARGEQGLAGLGVHRHEVQPVPGGGMQHGLDRGVSWAVDRARA